MPEGLTPSPNKKDKKEKYRRRQQEVFNAAAAVFAEKGYHGASTTDIATRLGIAQPSLYYYFSSKDEALEKICRIGTEGYLERLTAIIEGTGVTAVKIRAAVRNHIAPVLTIPDYVKAFQRERRYLPDDRRRDLSALTRQYDRLFRDLLEAGVTSGELRPDLDARVSALLLITQCNTAQHYIDEIKGPGLHELADIIAGNFLRGALV